MSTTTLYDQDFFRWTAQTARLLRERRFDQIDVDQIAEEIEDMGKSDKHAVENRLIVLLIHLLKWKCQPERRSRSWDATIDTQRVRLERVLRESPSLRARLGETIADVYPDAVRLAVKQTRLPKEAFPACCPFTPDQLLDPDYLPE